jgi:dimethylglycine dehydrogenase
MRIPPIRDAVVIGGGVAGTSITRELAAKGVGTTLLEKSTQLCAGATWHAAGLVTRFGGSPKIKKIHVRALELMSALHAEHDIGIHLTGSIRIIKKDDASRLLEVKQHAALAVLYDDPAHPTRLISAEEVKALHPLACVDRVECGLFTPHDGDTDPTLLTNCLAKLAKADGALFRTGVEVSGVRRQPDGRFVVATAGGEELTADAVVNAAVADRTLNMRASPRGG